MPRDARQVYTKSTHTRVLVGLYTDEPDGYSTEGLVQADPVLGKLISFQYNKSIGAASGAWTLVLKKSAQVPESQLRQTPSGLWRDPEDVWAQIKVVCDGQIFDVVLGLVDAVKEQVQRTANGQRSETITITGRDVGKILETTSMMVNFFHGSRPIASQSAIYDTWLEELKGTPAHFMRVLLETWLGNNGLDTQPWTLPAALGGGPFFNPALDIDGPSGARLRVDAPGLYGIQSQNAETHGEALAPSLMQIDQTGGNLWSVMQEWSNGLMNEMFIDLAPPQRADNVNGYSSLKPTFTIRERPFPVRDIRERFTSKARWNRLPVHELELGDIQSRDITKGGASQRFNYWKIQVNGLGSEGFNVDEILQAGVEGRETGSPGNIPIFNTESIRKHGLRPYVASTRYIPYHYRSRADEAAGETVPEEEQQRASFFRLAADWLKRLHDWYATAPFELSGTLRTTRMMPEIRIGQRVVEIREEGRIEYYVEGVSHSWQYPGGGSTTLTVTRGEYEVDDILEYVYRAYGRQLIAIVGDDEFTTTIDNQETGSAQRTLQQQIAANPYQNDSISDEALTVLLERERDGRTARDSGTTIDESNPSVGDENSQPTEAGSQAQTVQEAIERDEPLPELSGLDDLAGLGGDPIGGLNLTGTER